MDKQARGLLVRSSFAGLKYSRFSIWDPSRSQMAAPPPPTSAYTLPVQAPLPTVPNVVIPLLETASGGRKHTAELSDPQQTAETGLPPLVHHNNKLATGIWEDENGCRGEM